jgi:hypothetical protein
MQQIHTRPFFFAKQISHACIVSYQSGLIQLLYGLDDLWAIATYSKQGVR